MMGVSGLGYRVPAFHPPTVFRWTLNSSESAIEASVHPFSSSCAIIICTAFNLLIVVIIYHTTCAIVNRF